MALKMGGFTCDRCRKIITASYDLSKVEHKLRAKSGKWLHYCSAEHMATYKRKQKLYMTIEDLEETIHRAEEQKLSHLYLKYSPSASWKHRNQSRVRTPLGLANILGSSHTGRDLVIALPVETAKRYIARMKGIQNNGS